MSLFLSGRLRVSNMNHFATSSRHPLVPVVLQDSQLLQNIVGSLPRIDVLIRLSRLGVCLRLWYLPRHVSVRVSLRLLWLLVELDSGVGGLK